MRSYSRICLIWVSFLRGSDSVSKMVNHFPTIVWLEYSGGLFIFTTYRRSDFRYFKNKRNMFDRSRCFGRHFSSMRSEMIKNKPLSKEITLNSHFWSFIDIDNWRERHGRFCCSRLVELQYSVWQRQYFHTLLIKTAAWEDQSEKQSRSCTAEGWNRRMHQSTSLRTEKTFNSVA